VPASTRLLLSERFVSIQGEGASVGEPAAFVRLARCNLACSWCDTPYSWDFERYSFEEEVETTTALEVAEWLVDNAPGRVIWTGGEPLVQQKALVKAIGALDERRRARGARLDVLEVETNGTVPPLPALLERIDQWNVSPKLQGSGEPEDRRIVAPVLATFAATGRAYFKFVLADEADEREALDWIERLDLPRERVLLMPAAATLDQLRERSPWVAAAALRARLRFSGRLHLELFGGRRGT